MIQHEHEGPRLSSTSQSCYSWTASCYNSWNGRSTLSVALAPYHDGLTQSHFLITLLQGLLCTLTSRFTIYGMHLISRWMNNALRTCSNMWSGRKRRYYTSHFSIKYFANFLISRCKYMLHKETQSWEDNGWVTSEARRQICSYSSTSRQQVSVLWVESMVGPRFASHLVKPDHSDALNVGHCFLHIRLMVTSHGGLFIGRLQQNCLRIVSKTRFYPFVTHSPFYGLLSSWITPQYIAQRYFDAPCSLWSSLIHQALEKLCNDASVVLKFLPPYSPDFNPIEESFAKMKAWMRKNYTLQDNYKNFDGFLELAVQYMAAKAGNHFRSCHIHIPEQHDEE